MAHPDESPTDGKRQKGAQSPAEGLPGDDNAGKRGDNNLQAGQGFTEGKQFFVLWRDLKLKSHTLSHI